MYKFILLFLNPKQPNLIRLILRYDFSVDPNLITHFQPTRIASSR